jgi:uncharacterized membrane protein
MMMGMVFVEILWLLVLSLAIWALFTCFHVRRPERELSAREVLCLRYARGEIDTPTFEQMQDRLNEIPVGAANGEYWPQD